MYRAAATGRLTGARLYTVQCTPCTYTSVCKHGPVIKLGREAPYSTNVGTELANVGTELANVGTELSNVMTLIVNLLNKYR